MMFRTIYCFTTAGTPNIGSSEERPLLLLFDHLATTVLDVAAGRMLPIALAAKSAGSFSGHALGLCLKRRWACWHELRA